MRRTSIVAIALAACTSSTELGLRPGTLERVTPASLTAVVGTEIGPAPTVLVRDQNGTPLAGVAVVFSVALNSGYLLDDSLRTGADGTATGQWMAGPLAGNQTMTARSAGLGGVSFTAVARAGPVASMTRLLGNNQYGVERTGLPNRLSVKVTDSFYNAVAGVPVIFAVIAGDGSIAGDTATTNSAGIAESGEWILGGIGSQRVSAQSGNSAVVFEAEACESITWGCGGFDGSETTLAFSRAGHLYRVALDGTRVVQMAHLDNVWSSAWSPDGSRIAFARYSEGVNAIYLLKAGGEVTALTTPTDDYDSPAWSPDGRKLAVSGWVSGSGTSVYVMDADATGAKPVRLTAGSSQTWSPDGARIAFSDAGGVYVINADGTGRTLLVSSSASRWFWNPTWSPDGHSLAFNVQSNCDGDDDCDTAIGVLDLGTSDVRELVRGTRASSYAWYPAWSPDGSMIAFNRVAYGTAGCAPCVSTVRLDGTGERVIVADGSSPAWRR